MVHMTYTGSCYCKKVTFEVDDQMKGLINCHCGDCQKFHGNYNPMMITTSDKIKINGLENISWFQSSPTSKRGFCQNCGSTLFKQTDVENVDTKRILISAGCFDDTSKFKTMKNIWLESKGEYYIVPEEISQL